LSKSAQEEPGKYLHLTDRFTRAVDYARQVHVNYRKGTVVPYMAHLLGVVSIVMGECGHVDFPVTEDIVIAALLHDAVEDEGGLPRLRDIEANFGREVAEIVRGCSDRLSENAFPPNLKAHFWFPLPTKSTTPTRCWKTTGNSAPLFGKISSAAATNSFGISRS